MECRAAWVRVSAQAAYTCQENMPIEDIIERSEEGAEVSASEGSVVDEVEVADDEDRVRPMVPTTLEWGVVCLCARS
jgi:hypothetical protein